MDRGYIASTVGMVLGGNGCNLSPDRSSRAMEVKMESLLGYCTECGEWVEVKRGRLVDHYPLLTPDEKGERCEGVWPCEWMDSGTLPLFDYQTFSEMEEPLNESSGGIWND